MNRYLRLLVIPALVITLAGCYMDSVPVKSATVTQWQSGKLVKSWELSPEQVSKLTKWLLDHRWGWHPVIATYAPNKLVSITHTDGTTSGANVMAKVIVINQSQRSLSEEESHVIHVLLGEGAGG